MLHVINNTFQNFFCFEYCLVIPPFFFRHQYVEYIVSCFKATCIKNCLLKPSPSLTIFSVISTSSKSPTFKDTRNQWFNWTRLLRTCRKWEWLVKSKVKMSYNAGTPFFFQVDLLTETRFTKIATQGFNLNGVSSFVKTFTVQTSDDGVNFNTYQKNGKNWVREQR